MAPGYAGIVEKSDFALRPVRLADRQVLDQESFHKIVSRERKRTERSRRPFLLMLLDAGAELGMVPAEGGRRLTDLATVADMTKQAMGEFVADLADAGYVTVEL